MATTKEHQVWITQRTPVRIIESKKLVHCHKCKQDVHPKVVITAYLSLPLSKCPNCHSVIQGEK